MKEPTNATWEDSKMDNQAEIKNLSERLGKEEDSEQRRKLEQQIEKLQKEQIEQRQKEQDNEQKESKARQESEANEKRERESKEKQEREAKDKREREDKERREKQDKEKADKEAKEKAEKEAKEKEAKEAEGNSIAGGKSEKEKPKHDMGELNRGRGITDADLRRMTPGADLAQAAMSPAQRQVWQESEARKYEAFMAEANAGKAPPEQVGLKQENGLPPQEKMRVYPSGVEAEADPKQLELDATRIEKHEAQHEAKALDTVMDNEPAPKQEAEKEQPKEIEKGETVSGKLGDSYERDGQEYYALEASDGEKYEISKEAAEGYEKGDEVSVERTDSGYQVEEEYSYGR